MEALSVDTVESDKPRLEIYDPESIPPIIIMDGTTAFSVQRLPSSLQPYLTRPELPKEYPSDLPMYPGSTPTTSLMAGGSGLVVLSSTAQPADVLSHYRTELPNQGWTLDEVTEDPASIRAHKGGRTARISISSGDDGSTEIGVAIEGS